jgi:ferric-dicitrate binding protein FerR (iron transport regulator)
MSRPTALAAVAVALACLAAPAQAQAPPDPTPVPRAGVVAALSGTVLVQRASVPDPVPLKIGDAVLLLDVITTGPNARVTIALKDGLGVLVADRSVVTLSEEPGRVTLELGAGQLVLDVPPDRLKSGEALDVRTSNTLVTVRGPVRVFVQMEGPRVTHVDVAVGRVSVAAYSNVGSPIMYRGAPSAVVTLQAGVGVTVMGAQMGPVRAARSR